MIWSSCNLVISSSKWTCICEHHNPHSSRVLLSLTFKTQSGIISWFIVTSHCWTLKCIPLKKAESSTCLSCCLRLHLSVSKFFQPGRLNVFNYEVIMCGRLTLQDSDGFIPSPLDVTTPYLHSGTAAHPLISLPYLFLFPNTPECWWLSQTFPCWKKWVL